jgi:hypothetical protein
MNRKEEIALDFFLLHKGHDADHWLESGKSLNEAYHHLINGGFGDVEYIKDIRKDYQDNRWVTFNNLAIIIDRSKSKSGNEVELLIDDLDIVKIKINKHKYPILYGASEIASYAYCKVHLITDLKDEFHSVNDGVLVATPEYVDFLITNDILINELDKNHPDMLPPDFNKIKCGHPG